MDSTKMSSVSSPLSLGKYSSFDTRGMKRFACNFCCHLTNLRTGCVCFLCASFVAVGDSNRCSVIFSPCLELRISTSELGLSSPPPAFFLSKLSSIMRNSQSSVFLIPSIMVYHRSHFICQNLPSDRQFISSD